MSGQSIQAELNAFVAKFGSPGRVEVLIADSNGVFRGKWFPGHMLEKLMAKGTNFPISLLFGAIDCDTPASLLTGMLSGDPDAIYDYVPGSLRAVPWRTGAGTGTGMDTGEGSTAQIQLSLGAPSGLDPRASLVHYLETTGFSGMVALEGEFVLRNHTSALTGPQVYNLDALEEAEGFVADAYALAESQGVAVTSCLPEFGHGQFEINLDHTRDPVQAADDYMLSKRVFRAAAKRFGAQASFMALPFQGAAGNGCHIHVSLSDPTSGQNLLVDEHAASCAAHGILSTVNECMAILAPHANSYRRLDGDFQFNAPKTSWGENHRGVMLRMPKSTAENRRFEFRLAGADVNPYLLTHYVIAALRHGLALGKTTTLAKTPQGAAAVLGDPLVTRWHQALDCFEASAFARDCFGDDFVDLYARQKRHEEASHHAVVPTHEIQLAQGAL